MLLFSLFVGNVVFYFLLWKQQTVHKAQTNIILIYSLQFQIIQKLYYIIYTIKLAWWYQKQSATHCFFCIEFQVTQKLYTNIYFFLIYTVNLSWWYIKNNHLYIVFCIVFEVFQTLYYFFFNLYNQIILMIYQKQSSKHCFFTICT